MTKTETAGAERTGAEGAVAGGMARPARPAGDPAARAGAILDIDLDAAAWNYRRLKAELGTAATCAAVVKADGYGLGAAALAPVFVRAGADTLFVATIDEGLALRGLLDAAGHADVAIYILNGPLPGAEEDLRAFGLRPVLNSLGDLALWRDAARAAETPLPAALHVDTGMSRLGLDDAERARLAEAPGAALAGVRLTHIISHLACAETPGDPENAAQLARFRAARNRLPPVPASLANSSGIFLDAAYHFDLARPGVALYGVNPTPGRAPPMRRVVTLRARVLQVRQIDASRGVGYGATFRAQGPTRVATLAAGYADGVLRAGSNRMRVAFGGRLLPVIGRVSMDSITVDVTTLPADTPVPGDFMDLIGDGHDVDALAEDLGTSGYEVLTALGRRSYRVHHGGEGD